MTICKYMKEEEEGGWIIHMKAVWINEGGSQDM